MHFSPTHPIDPSDFELIEFGLGIVSEHVGSDGGSFPIDKLQFHQFGEFTILTGELPVGCIAYANYYLPMVVLLVELRNGLLAIVLGS